MGAEAVHARRTSRRANSELNEVSDDRSDDWMFWNLKPLRRDRRQTHEAAASADPTDILKGLPDRLISTLAGLQGAPPRVIEATLQLERFGSRAALLAYGIVEEDLESDATTGRKRLTLTLTGREVIATAALRAEHPRLYRLSLDELENAVDRDQFQVNDDSSLRR